MRAFLKREWIGGLSLIVAIATLFGSDFRFTVPVLILLAFGALWTFVVVADALKIGPSIASLRHRSASWLDRQDDPYPSPEVEESEIDALPTPELHPTALAPSRPPKELVDLIQNNQGLNRLITRGETLRKTEQNPDHVDRYTARYDPMAAQVASMQQIGQHIFGPSELNRWLRNVAEFVESNVELLVGRAYWPPYTGGMIVTTATIATSGRDGLPTREQQAHKLWADSCIELQRIEKMLAPAFERHQKALDACAEYGSENRLRMNPYMQEAWMTWEAKRQVELEREKGK
jgi:hypothetical protein